MPVCLLPSIFLRSRGTQPGRGGLAPLRSLLLPRSGGVHHLWPPGQFWAQAEARRQSPPTQVWALPPLVEEFPPCCLGLPHSALSTCFRSWSPPPPVARRCPLSPLLMESDLCYNSAPIPFLHLSHVDPKIRYRLKMI